MPVALPGRHERRAPRWDGSPRSMDEFLDEFEELCQDLGVPQERWIDAVARYAPNADIRSMWKALAASMPVTSTWPNYRKVLIGNTPGAGEDRRYTKSDLDELIATFRAKPMRTRLAFNEYWQRFYVILEYLFIKGRLSTEERSRKFIAGLPPSSTTLCQGPIAQPISRASPRRSIHNYRDIRRREIHSNGQPR